jgi:hypothetical protein
MPEFWTHHAPVQSTPSGEESLPSIQVKGKGREPDSDPVPLSGASASRRFVRTKDKIVGSLENMFLGGDGFDQDSHDYLSRGEKHLVSPFCTSRTVLSD